MVRMVVSLRTKNAVGSGWSTPISRSSGSRLFSVATDTSRALARPNSASPRRDQRNNHGFAGGRLHQRVEAGLFLGDLGDGGSGGVVERPGLHGRKAERLGVWPGRQRLRRKSQAQQGRSRAIRCDRHFVWSSLAGDHCIAPAARRDGPKCRNRAALPLSGAAGVGGSAFPSLAAARDHVGLRRRTTARHASAAPRASPRDSGRRRRPPRRGGPRPAPRRSRRSRPRTASRCRSRTPG